MVPSRCERCSITFQRVLGLAIKGLLLTAQRVFDVLAVLIHIMRLGLPGVPDKHSTVPYSGVVVL